MFSNIIRIHHPMTIKATNFADRQIRVSACPGNKCCGTKSLFFGSQHADRLCMGWLWNEIHDMFDEDDGSFPEICICGLSAAEVTAGYRLIREKTQFLVGGPRFFNVEAGCEMTLDEVENAAQLVCTRKAQPFHFMVRNLSLAQGSVHELGVFILDNAIALDYEKGRLWGELQIETLLLLINKLKEGSTKAFIRLEDAVSPNDKNRLEAALKRLASPEADS